MIDIREFISVKEKNHTKAFQKAIDLSSLRGGETIHVPFGQYVLSTVVLKDNISINFDDGVKIISVSSLDDFASDEAKDYPLYQDLSHSKYTKAMFYADNINNVKISGKAIIDMLSIWDTENKRAKDGYYRGAKVFSLRKVTNLEIRDIHIYNATDIAILMGACKNVSISNVYINSHIDGISPDGCENVIISDCNIKTGDDALVLKTSYFDNCIHHCKNINITNCVVSCRANAIKLGTESIGDFKYINISNCCIYDTNHSGIAIESVDGANIFGINISNITMNNVRNPIFIYLGERLRAPAGTKMGSISDINLYNVYADVHDQKYDCNDSWYLGDVSVIGHNLTSKYAINSSVPSIIMSTNADNKIKNVSLTNVVLKVLGGESKVEEILLDKDKYPECKNFRLPAYGIYSKNVDNLNLTNVKCFPFAQDVRKDIVCK